MAEENYKRVTYRITTAAAEILCRPNPQMTFIYVSGLCLWRWHRQFGAGDHVGSNQRKNRKCAASIAIRRSIHVRSGHNPAATRSEIQDDCLSSLSKLTKPLIPLLPLAFPKSRLTSQQIGRAMFDRSETWLSESGFGSKDIRAAVLTYLE
jgi:hypothetical protein